MMVPAVTEVWRPQPAHSNVQALVSSRQALLPPQPGQTNPSGQRVAIRYCAQAASSPKRCWNSINERGKSVMRIARALYVPDMFNSINERGKSVMRIARALYVPDMFYQRSTLTATTFCATGHRGIRLIAEYN